MEQQDQARMLGTPPEGTPVTDPHGNSGWADGRGGINYPGNRYYEQMRVEAPGPQIPQWHGAMMGHNPFTYAQEPKVVAGGLSVASLVCGIVGVVVGLIPILFIFAWGLGLVAMVLGAVAWGKRGKANVGRTMPAWGMTLGGVAFLLGVVGFVIVDNAFNDVERDLDAINQDLEEFDRSVDCSDQARTPEQVEACFAP